MINDYRERKLRLEEYFDEIIADGSEGLVVKNLDSPYILDDRHHSRWVKMKPDYGNGTRYVIVTIINTMSNCYHSLGIWI